MDCAAVNAFVRPVQGMSKLEYFEKAFSPYSGNGNATAVRDKRSGTSIFFHLSSSGEETTMPDYVMQWKQNC